MTRFYQRAARLTVWRPRATPTNTLGAFFDAIAPNAVEITGQRIQWDITKELGSTPNACKIIVTNLAEQTRAELQDLPRKVVLEVGFDGQFEHLFSGDIRRNGVIHELVGTDWETSIDVADGGRAYREARIVRSFGPDTPALTVIRETAAALGLELPRVVEQNAALRKQFANGYAVAGRASDELSRLLAPFGLGWSIQDGALQILAGGEVRPGQAIVIDKGSGMIGSPAMGTPSKPGAKPVLTVNNLVYPQVTPGCVIEVRAKRMRGQFKVQSVAHSGETHGPATTAIEAVAT